MCETVERGGESPVAGRAPGQQRGHISEAERSQRTGAEEEQRELSITLLSRCTQQLQQLTHSVCLLSAGPCQRWETVG